MIGRKQGKEMGETQKIKRQGGGPGPPSEGFLTDLAMRMEWGR